jgi:hypothetical protein
MGSRPCRRRLAGDGHWALARFGRATAISTTADANRDRRILYLRRDRDLVPDPRRCELCANPSFMAYLARPSDTLGDVLPIGRDGARVCRSGASLNVELAAFLWLPATIVCLLADRFRSWIRGHRSGGTGDLTRRGREKINRGALDGSPR